MSKANGNFLRFDKHLKATSFRDAGIQNKLGKANEESERQAKDKESEGQVPDHGLMCPKARRRLD